MTNQEYQKKLQELQTEIDELKANKPTEYKGWRAYGDSYYYIEDCGDFNYFNYRYEGRDRIDDYRYNTGNYFKTEKEAEQHKAYLLALQIIKDDAEGWIPDWRSDKYHGYYNHEANELNIGWSLAFQYQGVIYFETEKKLRHSQKVHKAEWLTVLGVEQ